jgi:hypothetical protein
METNTDDEKVFREGEAIFGGDDLRELINYIYSEYQYRGAQYGRLVNLIDYLASENNRFINPALDDQSHKLSDYLDTFREFLLANFHQSKLTEDGNTIFTLQTQTTSSETEAFLAEFQMLAMDTEKAYKNYHTAVSKIESTRNKNP